MTHRLPLDLPPLQSLAEDAAQEHFNALAATMLDAKGGGTHPQWRSVSLEARDNAIGAQLRLLADLDLPASRDAWVRWGMNQERIEVLRVPASPENDRRQDALVARWTSLRDDTVNLSITLRALANP